MTDIGFSMAQEQIRELRAEVERLTAERDFAREAIAQKCRQYDVDMKTMLDALNREIEARTKP